MNEVIKFEYTIENFGWLHNKNLINALNKMGEEGWELVSVNNDNYIFKKQFKVYLV